MTLPTYLRFADLKAKGIVNSWPSLNQRIKNSGFPPGRKIGPNCRVWTEEEVQARHDTRPVDKKPNPWQRPDEATTA